MDVDSYKYRDANPPVSESDQSQHLVVEGGGGTFIEHTCDDSCTDPALAAEDPRHVHGGSQDTTKPSLKEADATSLSLIEKYTKVWGWLVPSHPSNPHMTVRWVLSLLIVCSDAVLYSSLNFHVRPLSSLDMDTHFKVGRDETKCDYVLRDWMFPSDSAFNIDQTSRLHFLISRKNGKSYLENKSSNGTFVNGTSVSKDEERCLKNGSRISILSQDLELFWYIDEDGMLMENNYPAHLVSRYIIGNVVGEGTFGVVRKGFDKINETFRPVALKFVNKAKLRFTYQWSDEDEAKMMTEVKILRQMNHPCVTELVEFFNAKDVLVIVMEFAEGGELEKQVLLDKTMGRLSESVAKFQFYQISHTVAYLHSINICHRDLKLSNILMSQPDPECLLKISDFGISKIWTAENLLRTKIGTPMFMAPEVNNATSGSEYTCKADCWALGIVLYQLLAGVLPHDSNGSTEGPEWEHISDLAKDLVHKLLNDDPNERLEAAGILHHAWFVSDPLVSNRSRNKMFQTEDSFVSFRSLALEAGSKAASFNQSGSDAELAVSLHNTNLNSSRGHGGLAVAGPGREGRNNNPGQAVANGVRAPVSSQLREFNEDWSLAKGSLCMDSSEASSKPSNGTVESGGDQPVTSSEDPNKKDKASDEEIVRNELDLQKEEEKINFDDIKSRLRPRTNHINYYKSNVVQSISQVSKIPNVDVSDGKSGSGKRKSSEQKRGKVSFNYAHTFL